MDTVGSWLDSADSWDHSGDCLYCGENMNRLERLKELCNKPIPTDGLDKIQLDFEIQKLAREVLPKILDALEAGEACGYCLSPIFEDNSIAWDCGKCSGCKLRRTLDALRAK